MRDLSARLFRCGAVSDATSWDAFAAISLAIAKVGAPADCYDGDAGVNDLHWDAHRRFAIDHSRGDAAGNLAWKLESAFACAEVGDAARRELARDTFSVLRQADLGSVTLVADLDMLEPRLPPPMPPPPPPPPPPPLGDAKAGTYIGCFKDTNDFDLDGHLERSNTNSPQFCIATCAALGFVYAGVQYGESCLCGNTYGRYGKAEKCDYACTGDAAQTCGGYSTNAIYTTGVRP